MRLSEAAVLSAAGTALAVLVAALASAGPVTAAPAKAPPSGAELDAVRQECITAARCAAA